MKQLIDPKNCKFVGYYVGGGASPNMGAVEWIVGGMESCKFKDKT